MENSPIIDLWGSDENNYTPPIHVEMEVKRASLNDAYQLLFDTQAKIKAIHDEYFAKLSEILPESSAKPDLSIDHFADHMIADIFAQARTLYSSTVPLTIDRETEMAEMGLSNFRREFEDRASNRYRRKRQKLELPPLTFEDKCPVDLDKIKQHLEKKFGAGASLRIAHKQNATVIVKYFCLEEKQPVESKQGVLLSKHHYVRKEKSFSNTCRFYYEYDRSACDEFGSAMKAMAIFAEYAGLPTLAAEVMALESQVKSKKVEMPQIINLTQVKLKIVASSRLDLTLPFEVANKLKLYLGEYYFQ